MPDQDGLRFLFDIQDKITAKLAKIEAKAQASKKKIDNSFTRASRAQETHSAKLAAMEERRVAQGKILAQRLTAAQSREARQAANFRIAAAKRAASASEKSERAIAKAAKDRARVAVKAEKDHQRALKMRAREQKRVSEASVAMARKSAFVLAALGAALAATSVKLVALGSDAEETENVTGLAFGEMKGAAEKWAASFAESTGSSRFESIELVSDLGLIVKGMGFTEEASLGMSSRMVELAADMASAKNVPLDVALEKIRAGLIGESEPLRTMGVLLSEARVKEEAYASGIAKTGSELTNTQKVQARMNIILADSTAMHGDLINTQGSVANQWRAIKNRVFDAATTIGQNLLPAASKVLGKLGEWVGKGADLLTWITESNDRMKTFGAILAGVVVTGLGLAAAALWALVPAITAATGGINLLIPAIAAGVGALVAGWILFGDTIKDFLRGIWAKMLNKIGAGLETLSNFVGIFRDDWADAMRSAGEGLQATAADMGKVEKATEKLAKKQEKATEAAEAATGRTKLATKEQRKAAEAAKKHAEKIADLGQTLQGLPTKAAIKEFEDLREAWASLGTEEQAEAMAAYSDALIEAEEAGHDLDKTERAMNVTRKWTLVLWRRLEEAFINGEAAAKKRSKANKKALEAEAKELKDLNERLDTLRERLLGLPTDKAIQDFEELTRTWEGMDEEEKAVATERYRDALRDAATAGHELNKAQLAMTESSESFFGKFKGGFKSMIDGITGGKGIKGVMEGIGKGITQGIGNIISGGLAAIAGLALKGIVALGKKIWGGIKSLFGFTSGAEKEGRKVAHEFRQGIIAGLTPEQFTEVGLSWKEGWDSSVIIAVRDAAMAGGASFEAASALGRTMYEALWAAEKKGPDAVQRVIGQINAIIDAGNAAGEAAAAAAEDRARRIQAHQDTIDDIEEQRAAKRLEFKLKAIEEEREAELEALRDKHTAELEAIADQRSAKMEEFRQGKADALALIEEEREDALEILRGKHTVELEALDQQASARLSALKAMHSAELSEIEKARRDALSPIEQGIQDELDDAKIAVQLRIDLKKAGWDAEKIDAANARAAEATERLEERRLVKAGMDEAEAEIRARYQPEIDAINAHWDAKHKVATDRHKIEVDSEVAKSKLLRETMEDRHEAEIQAVNDTFDAKMAAAETFWDDTIAEWETFFDDLEEKTRDRHEAEIEAVNEHYDALIDAAKGIIRRSLEEWEQYYDDLVAIERAGIAAIEAEVPDPTVNPPSVTVGPILVPGSGAGSGLDEYTPGGIFSQDKLDNMQHGGPVRSGRPYIVGEAGPEMFIPSSSGRIEPNGSSGGGVDPKALARAVADALEGVKMDVDGRDFGRLVVRHQPRAAAELGGRR